MERVGEGEAVPRPCPKGPGHRQVGLGGWEPGQGWGRSAGQVCYTHPTWGWSHEHLQNRGAAVTRQQRQGWAVGRGPSEQGPRTSGIPQSQQRALGCSSPPPLVGGLLAWILGATVLVASYRDSAYGVCALRSGSGHRAPSRCHVQGFPTQTCLQIPQTLPGGCPK